MSLPLKKDIGAWVKAEHTLSPQNSADDTTTSGASVDKGDALSGVIVGSIGAVTGTPTGISVIFRLQDSPDGTTGWANVLDLAAAIVETAPATAIDTTVELDVLLQPTKQFLRIQSIVDLTAGTTPTVDVGAVLVVAGKSELPD